MPVEAADANACRRASAHAVRVPCACAERPRLPVARTGRWLAGTVLGSGALAAFADEASASWLDTITQLPSRVDPHGAVGLAVFLGLVIFSTTTALIHIGQRRRWSEREARLIAENHELRIRNDRSDILLSAEPQIVVAWGGRGGEPDIEGDLSLVSDALAPRRVLGFGSWLPPAEAQALEASVEKLKERGEPFRTSVRTTGGRVVEAEGRPVLGRAVLRLREISGDRLELLHLKERMAATTDENVALRTMLDTIAMPMWLRDAEGRLTWANSAYARAVEAIDGAEAVSHALELLDRPVRDEAQRQRTRVGSYKGRVPAVVAGERRIFDVFDVNTPTGSVGIACDMSEVDELKSELKRLRDSHAATLDQLPTAVAIFDGGKRLRFCNSAYRELWQLDVAFLDQNPTDGEILDRLRSQRRLPEQADYRAWKTSVLGAYQAIEPKRTSWYLPSGRSLRVVTNPNPDGGVTYLFDDVTERFNKESRFNAELKVRGETIAALKEGVAVFGSDGRLQLHNKSFARMWDVSDASLQGNPHIEQIIAVARRQHPEDVTWNRIRGAVGGLDYERRAMAVRMQRSDGTVVDCTAAPLPEGATLLTFVDVTASVNVQQALAEKNEALERAGQIRETFVHSVSFELRSPLTNVIGFTELLADGTVGPLTEKQKDYALHILRSSQVLMTLIDDILDLATIDKGEIELKLGPVNVEETVEAALAGIKDRIAEMQLNLVVDVASDIGPMVADAKRVRQVLFNLLSNAVGFSRDGQTITVTARREDDEIVICVKDQGRGIPADVIAKVFDRFESFTKGSSHRGVGLGLSIVRSFVELHGGRVSIESTPGKGTLVTCTFPADGLKTRDAAE
jgi:signal transduction histidine kinase